jgi:hypothetical protein
VEIDAQDGEHNANWNHVRYEDVCSEWSKVQVEDAARETTTVDEECKVHASDQRHDSGELDDITA